METNKSCCDELSQLEKLAVLGMGSYSLLQYDSSPFGDQYKITQTVNDDASDTALDDIWKHGKSRR